MSEEMRLKISVKGLLDILGGRLLQGDEATELQGIGTDTRQKMEGQLFIPFQGENFDAHDFLGHAEKQGARAALVHRRGLQLSDFSSMAIIEVEDTLKAFQALANHRRRHFSAKVLGITGSNGKTTTKEFTAAILANHTEVFYSKKSFNNHWGVPISILSVGEKDQVALLEMGMNHRGELTELCQIAEPDIVTVVFVGRSHLEGLGSVEGVAIGKEEIYSAAPESALRVFNLQNSYTLAMYERACKKYPADRLRTFGTADSGVFFQVDKASVEGMEISGEIDGVAGSASVPVFGRHNVLNLMAAASLALACGMPAQEIWPALKNCRTTWGRGEFLSLPAGTRILFDGYNSNPESMKVFLENLDLLDSQGKKIAVIGEMRELGEHSEEEHRQLGRKMASMGFQVIWFVGPSAADFEAGLKLGGFSETLYISNVYEENLAMKIASVLEPSDNVVIKGSRGVQLEKVVQAWGLKKFKYSV